MAPIASLPVGGVVSKILNPKLIANIQLDKDIKEGQALALPKL